MDRSILGLIYIVLGAIIVFVVAADFIFKAAIAILGLYLIYRGLQLRNSHHQVLFYIHRFRNRF
jgi:uncharacterized membrane protein